MALLLASGLLAGCATLFGSTSPPRGDVGCCQAAQGLELHYLGTGGWILRWGGATVLTAPYASNVGIPAAVFGPIRADTARIDARVPSVPDAAAILVGHAHFDHLLDVPYVARVKAPRATVYGSRTTRHILAGDPGLDPSRVVAVNAGAGTYEAPGRWLPAAGGRVRIMALEAGHAPHFQGVELYEGTVDAPLSRLPDRAEDWVGGVTYAYLIDFLDAAGDVAFRVHYQDAASSAPRGLIPPLAPGDRAPVDVVILCQPGFGEVDGFPEGILLNARPRVALLGHWENFLRPPSPAPRSLPFNDVEAFRDRLERVLPQGSAWRLPTPGETFRVARVP